MEVRIRALWSGDSFIWTEQHFEYKQKLWLINTQQKQRTLYYNNLAPVQTYVGNQIDLPYI